MNYIDAAREVTTTKFVCINCGQTGRTDHDHEARADLAGTPFEAYYCGECARDIAAAKAKP